MWIERKFEGDRAAAHEARPGGWSSASSGASRQARGLDRHLAVDRLQLRRLLHADPHAGRGVLASGLGPWETFWILFYGFATYGNAGFMREQVCKYMCPYARFQSAMFDKDTLIITYDAEPAASRAARAPRRPTQGSWAWASASTATCACRSAPPASTSARACSTSASAAPPASTCATT
jgi:hypothetical protein